MDDQQLESGLEKGTYSTFRQQEVSWRQSAIASKLITYTDLQLPTNSVLHIVDKLLDTVVHSIIPDVTNPFIKNESLAVWLTTLLVIPGKDAVFPIDESYRFRPSSFNQELRKFVTDHKQIKRALTVESIVHRSNILPVVNYNAILTPIVTGTFAYYRRFDILLRTILNTMVGIEGKQQYLQIPLSRTVYSKNQFLITADAISYLTVRIKTDPSFFFLIHLINFLSKTATASLFKQLDETVLDTFNLILTAGDQAIIYNLGDLKAMLDARHDNTLYQLVIRHINTLKLSGHAEMDISTLDEPTYDKLIEDVSIPSVDEGTPGESPVVIPSSRSDPLPHDQKIPHSIDPVLPQNHPESPISAPMGVDKKSHQDAGKPTVKQSVSAPIQRPDHVDPPTDLKPLNPTSLTSVIDHSAHQVIMNTPTLTDAQKAHALIIAHRYKSLLIDGVPIEEHLEQTAEPDITTSHLDFLKDKVVDASMLNSTAVDLDNHYIKHMMARDLAAVAANMTAHGMFLIQTEQHDLVTALDRIRSYKLVYEDLTGRRHTVAFKFPIISPDGTIMINGIESRMIKQQVNLPICKIDSWRVSLASNYNKTIVERISTRAHNYGAYITRYIAAVYKEKLGLQINYGQLTTDAVLPYDYSSIAKRYSRLSFTGHRFIFDYEHRFAALIEQGYNENGSTFTRDGREYDLGALLAEANQRPTEMFKIDDLKWILDHVETDPERLENANLSAPILVTRDKQNRLDVIDGIHRLTKSIAEGRDEILGRFVPADMVARYDIGEDPGPGPGNEALSDAYAPYQLREKQYGVYCGTASVNGYVYKMFFGYDNLIRFIGPNRGMTAVADQLTIPFAELFFSVYEDKVSPPKQLAEWTELKILDRNFPVVFILGFEYGLQRVIDHLKLDHHFVPSGTRVTRKPSTIVVPFADGNLVFDRYPLQKSFVLSGLLKFDTKPYAFATFNTPDSYYLLLQDNMISMNYLKGITDFFKLFVDPITRDVLLRMHEPTDVGGLLLRATEMLSTDDVIPASSMRNHRLRGYERFPTTLYNEMARAYAAFNRQRGNRKVYSINPEAVFQRLIQDQTLRIVDEINPMENIKDKHSATYTGSGGRTAQSFVIEDRLFPKDGVGILSECTPDNNKVAINAYITANPVIANIRGMFDIDSIDQSQLTPSQILSVTSLLMPCATNDDARRSNYLSIQLKHHVPSEFSETNRVRTGYETVVAHRTSETFACVAKQDGVIASIDNDLGIIRVRYTTAPPPHLDLTEIAKDTTIQNQFVEHAVQELDLHHPIYIAQLDAAKTPFKLYTLYTFKDKHLQVVDIIPLTDRDAIPMGDYLTPEAKTLLQKAKHPVLIKLMPVTHNPADDVDIFKFGTKFSSVAGSFLKQTIVVNVKSGDSIKRGDVIAYNSGFFELDPFDSRQVTWKHGIMASVALMECNDTVEDSNAVTEDFSRRLMMSPAHMRTLQLTADTVIRDVKPIGTEVQTTDLLCILEDADIASLSESDNSEIIDLLTELNRKAPRARYHGVIAEMDILYACPISEMHPSLAAIAKQIDARKHALAKAAADTNKAFAYAEPSQVTPGTKFHGIEFAKDTVILIYYITENISYGAGDKSVLALQAKSVCATVIEKPISTESGYPIDMLFSARSISNRIILSPTLLGFCNRCLQTLEDRVVKLYFEN